ncbi:MAG: HipA domain-containing protein, partial [Candidatus Cloacimonetes bacterium]|nr:HipA domain-containing protein [Candidatus Cloacimonadota bacterium]
MKVCLSCLKKVEKDNYCSSCLKKLFYGKNPILDISKKEFSHVQYELLDRFSISGVQDKISLKLDGIKLIPTDKDGEYILKPIPGISVPIFQNDIPANEHLTMQIAKQLFNIQTAENALINFSDGEQAYITKRFDRKNGSKLRQEDFCQLSGKTPEMAGINFRYDGSYQEAGGIVKRFCAAYKVELEKLFTLILFNYLLGNGDAHLKNFSLIESVSGDFVLSPAYDLINTTVHFPNESRMALDLFIDYETESFKENGFYKKTDFMKLAEFYEIKHNRTERIIQSFLQKNENVKYMIKSSLLSKDAKDRYLEIFEDRL